MKWFKHYSDATNSTKLSQLFDELGAEGYGYYWLFLELISSKFDGSLGEIRVHFGEVLGKFRLNNRRKLLSFIKTLNNLDLIRVEFDGKFLQIQNDILVKLKQKNFKIGNQEVPEKVPLELEENKDKEKEQEERGIPVDPLRVIECYNETLGQIKGRYNYYALPNTELKNFLESIKFKELSTLGSWQNVFLKVEKSNHLNKQTWCDFFWLLKAGNAMKVLQGTFDSFDKKDSLSVEITEEAFAKFLEEKTHE